MALSMPGKAALELHTPRLLIMALTMEQFGLLLESPARLALVMGFAAPGAAWDAPALEAMQGLYGHARAHPDTNPWYANWQIVSRAENRPVGSLCFMGPPHGAGVVEIGYGTDAPYRGRGYMTEAVGTVCAWALRQTGVSGVRAETDPDNQASQAVLLRNGFRPDGSTAETLVWRLDR